MTTKDDTSKALEIHEMEKISNGSVIEILRGSNRFSELTSKHGITHIDPKKLEIMNKAAIFKEVAVTITGKPKDARTRADREVLAEALAKFVKASGLEGEDLKKINPSMLVLEASGKRTNLGNRYIKVEATRSSDKKMAIDRLKKSTFASNEGPIDRNKTTSKDSGRGR